MSCPRSNELKWIKKLRPKETAFIEHEKEFYVYFEKEKESLRMLKAVMLPDNGSQIHGKGKKTTKKYRRNNEKKENIKRLRSDAVGNVVLKLPTSEYRFHFFFLLQLVKSVILKYVKLRESADNDQPAENGNSFMVTAFKDQMEKVPSVEYFKKKRNEYNSRLKKVFGNTFDLDNFEHEGKKIFSEKNIKNCQINEMENVMTALEELNKRHGMIDHVKNLAVITCNKFYEKTCNILQFFMVYANKTDTKKTCESLKGVNVDRSYTASKKLADNENICFSEESYWQLIKKPNFAPTVKDIREYFGSYEPLQENTEKAKTLSFESGNLALYNLGLITSAMKKNAEIVPKMLRISDADLINPELCVSKLEELGKTVKNSGMEVQVQTESLDILNEAAMSSLDISNAAVMSTIKTYVLESDGIVAYYRTTQDNVERLIVVKWIEPDAFFEKVHSERLMKPDIVLQKYFEIEGHCRGFAGGIQVSQLKNSEGINSQILDYLKTEQLSFRDASAAAHHVVKHGDKAEIRPVHLVTGEKITSEMRNYREKICETAKLCTLKDVDKSGFSQNGNYCLTIKRKTRQKGESQKIAVAISQKGLLTLTTAF